MACPRISAARLNGIYVPHKVDWRKDSIKWRKLIGTGKAYLPTGQKPLNGGNRLPHKAISPPKKEWIALLVICKWLTVKRQNAGRVESVKKRAEAGEAAAQYLYVRLCENILRKEGTEGCPVFRYRKAAYEACL